MYTSYLAACKPQITQRESEMKDKRIKTRTKKLLKLESLREKNKKTRLETKQSLGAKALSVLTSGPQGHRTQCQLPTSPAVLSTGIWERPRPDQEAPVS